MRAGFIHRESLTSRGKGLMKEKKIAKVKEKTLQSTISQLLMIKMMLELNLIQIVSE